MKPLNYVFVQLEFAGRIIMSSTGNIILAVLWIPGSLLWFFCAENPVVGIIWLCGGIVELVIALIRRKKEKKSR